MIKNLKPELKRFIKSRKINVFFLFLLLAFVILIFTKLSKEYTNTMTFNIHKINVPQDIVILNDSNTTLKITLKTHGFKWLKYYFSQPAITIDFSKDVDKRNSMFTWSKSRAYLYSDKQFGKQVELLNISPDTLLFGYDVNLIKKIPVIFNANVKFSPGFDISQTYKIEPDSIQVIGPHALASRIENIETEQIILEDIKSDILKSVKLKLPENNKDLKFSSTHVKIKATVKKFTEGTLKIPVTITNIPNGLTLKYFPKEVNVTYYTSLDNFNAIKSKDFKVECDYTKISNNQSFLIPQLTKFPETVKNLKINQQHIEFIIVK